MKFAYSNDEVFVLLRYDVYDYYCDYLQVNNLIKRDDAYIVITKAYDDFKLMEMELKNILHHMLHKIHFL